MIYRDRKIGFEITFPEGWKRPGILHRLLLLPLRLLLRLMFASPALTWTTEFYGPAGEAMKFAVGPISPELSVSEHQRNVQIIAMRRGHRVVEVSTIEVAGKMHATMVVDIPSPSGWMRLKNYFLIFRGTEYVVTVPLIAVEEEYDQIVETFRPI